MVLKSVLEYENYCTGHRHCRSSRYGRIILLELCPFVNVSTTFLTFTLFLRFLSLIVILLRLDGDLVIVIDDGDTILSGVLHVGGPPSTLETSCSVYPFFRSSTRRPSYLLRRTTLTRGVYLQDFGTSSEVVQIPTMALRLSLFPSIYGTEGEEGRTENGHKGSLT